MEISPFWQVVFWLWLLVAAWTISEHVKFSTIVITFIIGYAVGVASILGVIYYFILIRFDINILDPSTHDLVCSRAK